MNDFFGIEPRSRRQFYYRPLQGDAILDNGNQGLRASHSRRPYPWLNTDAPSGACLPHGIIARILRCIRSRHRAVNGYEKRPAPTRQVFRFIRSGPEGRSGERLGRPIVPL